MEQQIIRQQLDTLQKEWHTTDWDDFERRTSIMKQRIFLMQKLINWDPRHVEPKTVAKDTRSDLDDLRRKLVPR